MEFVKEVKNLLVMGGGLGGRGVVGIVGLRGIGFF